MRLTPSGNIFGLIVFIFLLFPLNTFAYQTPDVNITPEGVIDSFSVSCSGTNATAILSRGYPFGYVPGEYMRRPCVNGIVTFDSFDLNGYILRESGPVTWPTWLQWYKPPFDLIVKDTTNLIANDAPNFTELVRMPGSPGVVITQFDDTYPTLAVGSSFNYDGFVWTKNPPLPYVPELPPEPIGDPNNLQANISPEGDVPRVSINCIPGHDYTLSLVHRNGDTVHYTYGVKQRKLCGGEGVLTFDGFNLTQLLADEALDWWRYYRTPIEYIIKDTTGIYECHIYYCPLINLTSASNNYDWSLYLASSTVWQTVGRGPIYQVDETYTVWSNINTQTEIGNSSVMFFPGVMGSRLYESVGTVDCDSGLTSNDCIRESEQWVSVLDSNHSRLALNTNGNSVNNIYTKDDTQSLNDETETGIIDEAYGFNIYNSFINSLRNWKNDGTIKDYYFIPYDWRLSLEDIISNGATSTGNKLSYTSDRDFSESYILRKLEDLQKTSDSGKVTLIGHSNGGLVIKALVQRLKETNNPLYEKIDQIILVAVPQVGTPDALVALLHGKRLAGGFVMGSARSRQLSENMASLYNFLPSERYFDTVNFLSATSTVINFEDNPLFSTQISEYGFVVSNKNEIKNFVLGTDGRDKPLFSETNKPNIGNSFLYSNADSTHSILDSFLPASTTKVVQVAGWGVETISGINYVARRSYLGAEYPSYRIRYVIDGDGTVVVPSALWMSTSSTNIERWWVNLDEYNTENAPDRVHRDILEIPNLNEFIKSKITKSLYLDTDNIVVNNTSTLVSDETRLHYTLHSPLTLGVYDSLGRYTGLDPTTLEIKKEIPGVNYEQIGEVQVLSIPGDLQLILKMKGLNQGSFSLDVDKQTGFNIVDSISFQGIPSDENTKVEMSIIPNAEINNSVLNIDQDGDGIVDKFLEIKDFQNVIYDDAPPEIEIIFDKDKKDVNFSTFDLLDLNPVLSTTSEFASSLDNQGNKTILNLKKHQDSENKLKFDFNSILTNNTLNNLLNTNVVYEWQKQDDVISILEIKVSLNNVYYYISYKKSTNITTIVEKTLNGTKTVKKQGFVPVILKTDKGLLKVDY